jgi:hypothetical protein
MRRIGGLAAWIVIWVAGSASAAPRLIAPLHGGTTIEAYGDVQVWSDYDATDELWHLVVRRGGLITTPPIPTATRTIEADVGPGPSGSPLLVYTVCPGGCHLVVSGVDGSDPRAIPASRGASHPTIWGDRVAWVRGEAEVMTSLLDGAGRRMLAGAPRRMCYPALTTPERTICEATKHRRVESLKLYYRRLAFTDQFYTNNSAANGDVGELRTEAIDGGPQHVIALEGGEEGEGETIWLGPSWSEGKLYFYQDGTSECENRCTHIYGFDPKKDTYIRAEAFTELTGFSMTAGRRAYEATAPGDGETSPSACAEALKGEPAMYVEGPCVARLSAPIAFQPSRPPIVIP